MSFILDALKRAERERKLDQPPDLSAVYQEEYKGAQKSRSRVWIGGAALVAAMALGYVFWPGAPFKKAENTQSVKTADTATKSRTPSKPQPVPPSKRVVKKNHAEAAPSRTEKAKPPEPPSPKPVKGRDALKGRTHVLGASSQNANTAVGVQTPNDFPKETEIPREKAETALNPPPNEVLIEEARAAPRPSPGDEHPKPAGKKSLSLRELPPEMREAVALLTINVHVYDRNPRERRVFINMKGYREGDAIGETGFRLSRITPNGAIIDYGGGTVFLPVKHK